MKKIVSLFALTALAASLAWGSSVEEHIKAAQTLMRRGRLKDAKVELLVAQRLAPQREDIQSLLAAVEPGAQAVTTTAALSVGGDALVGAKVEEALAQARSAYRDSDLKGAREAWGRALQLQPGDKEGAEGLARLDQEQYHRDADQPFDQSVADLYEAGLREARKQHLVEAKKKLEDALSLNPMQPQVKAALATLSQGAKDQQAGRDAEQWVIEGQAALKENDWARAGNAFQQALKQAPTLGAAKEGQAQVRERGALQAAKAVKAGQEALDQGRWEEAEKQFSLALTLDPERAEALEGQTAARQRSTEAKSAAAQRRETDQLYNAGVEAWSAGDLQLAASRFRDVLKLDAKDPEAQRALQAVRRKLDERADKDRADAAQLVEEARTLEGRGAPEEALKRYERALVKDPAQAEAAKAKDRLLAALKAP